MDAWTTIHWDAISISSSCLYLIPADGQPSRILWFWCGLQILVIMILLTRSSWSSKKILVPLRHLNRGSRMKGDRTNVVFWWHLPTPAIRMLRFQTQPLLPPTRRFAPSYHPSRDIIGSWVAFSSVRLRVRVFLNTIILELFEISSWNFYGSKICSKAHTSWKMAAFWWTGACGWWFNITDIPVELAFSGSNKLQNWQRHSNLELSAGQLTPFRAFSMQLYLDWRRTIRLLLVWYSRNLYI